MINTRLLHRAQWMTLGGGAIVGAVMAFLVSVPSGVGVAVGSAWSAANLRAMEGLLGAAILPRDHPRDMRRIFIWVFSKLALYVLAIWLLIVAPFPPTSLAIGLTVMLAMLVLAGLTTRKGRDQTLLQRGDDADA